MGRGRKGAGAKRGLYPPKRAPVGGQDKKDEWTIVEDADKKNALFEEYYRTQGILPEEEFPVLLESLASDLPTTFRVTGSRAHAETINDVIKNKHVPNMLNVEWEGKTYPPPSQIPWYPGKLAWELSAPKRVVRKSQPFKQFQKFLVGETEVGNLSRQEAVSMIPPLLLDVQPHHICMDMCAAPGSKTAQIIEALNPHHTESSGVLIANDSDYKRTHMLVHQTGRMPSKGLIVTNLDASFIPNIDLGGGKDLQFDRILADVPCSGDGTMRKNFEIWKKWGANDGNSLHTLQLRILERGMKSLRPGGRLVYSTCSFNPVENEAVVAAALNLYPGAFSLVDVSSQLPELKRRPGITSWKVATQKPTSEGKALVWHDSYAAYMEQVDALSKQAGGDQDKKRPLPSSAWPPSNATELGLERCLRLVPQDQNTGGFFVCVFEKASDVKIDEPVNELPPLPAAEEIAVADETGSSTLKREASPSGIEGAERDVKRVRPEGEAKKPGPSITTKKKRPDPMFKEDAYSFVDPNHAEVNSVIDWFQLNERFDRDKLMVRNESGAPLRTIYLVNDTVKAILNNNDYSRLRIVSAGVKSFVRQDSGNRGDIPCKWRVPMDGILEVVPSIPEHKIVDATLDELKIFLSEMYPPIDKFSESAKAWMNEAQLGNVIAKFAAGDSAGGSLPLPMYLPIWKAKTSMSLLVDKREKSILSLRVFGEDLSPTTDFKKTIKQEGEGEEEDVIGSAETAAKEAIVDDANVKQEDVKPEGAKDEDEEAAMNA